MRGEVGLECLRWRRRVRCCFAGLGRLRPRCWSRIGVREMVRLLLLVLLVLLVVLLVLLVLLLLLS